MRKLFPFFLFLCFLLNVSSWNVHAEVKEGRSSVYTSNLVESDTLIVQKFSVSDTLQITMGVVVSRLEVQILDQSRWSVIDPEHWLWNPNSADWWIRPEYHAFYADTTQLQFIYNKSSFEPRFNDTELWAKKPPEQQGYELKQTGRISRGIISGTNQEISLESGLDITLEGNISEETTLKAILTDRNIPFQPDGTTQTIREFDQVLIQVQNPVYNLKMGDVDILFEDNEFHRLDRRIKGGYFERKMNYADEAKGTVRGTLSTTRGEYANEQIAALEGVQGPYRIGAGRSNLYSVILAGTEKVYLNGERLKRGADFDYTIDYSLGEITFTKQQLIRQETRIFVEYEYIEQGYNRSLIASEAEIMSNDQRFAFRTMYSREADNDGLLAQQILSDEAISLLQNTTDPSDLYVDSGRLWDDASNIAVAYTKKDTLYVGESRSIYEHSSSSNRNNKNLYRVNFSYLGPSLGDYELIEGSLNQPIYQWVGPNKGSYVAKEPLKAPIQHQILSLAGDFSWSPNLKVTADWSMSDYQYNRFARVEGASKQGMAYRAGIQWQNEVFNADQSTFSAQLRSIDVNYESSERIQEVEYLRLYDLDQNVFQQHLMGGEWNWQKNNHTFEVGISELDVGDEARLRQFVAFNSNQDSPWKLSYDQDYVQRTKSSINNGYWFRQKGYLNVNLGEAFFIQPFDSYSIGMHFEQEQKLRQSLDSDSLYQGSFRFVSFGPGIMADYDRWSWGMSWLLREEEQVFEGKWNPSLSIFEQRYHLSWETRQGFTGKQMVHIRNRNTEDLPFDEAIKSTDQSLLLDSRIIWGKVNKLGQLQWDYEALSKQRSSFREVYVYVGPELGQYVWIDDNEDRIQQLIEFYPELSPNEGTYIKRLLPGNSYEPIVQLRTRIDYDWEPFQGIKSNRPLLGSLQLKLMFLLRDENKSNSLDQILLLDKATLFKQGLSVSGGKDQRYSIRFRPNATGLEGGIEWLKTATNHERNIEYLINAQQSFQTDLSYRWSNQLKSRLLLTNKQNLEYSDALRDKNYAWSMNQIQPSIEYRFNRSWNMEFSGFIKSLTSDLGYARDYLGDERAQEGFPDFTLNHIQLSMHHRVFIPNGIQATAQLAVQDISSDNQLSSYSEYRLTEGMGTGRTAKWQVSSSYLWNDWLEIEFDYYGRTSYLGVGIHTVQLKLSALF